jgi:mono/diheme cytochrome c family protein
MKSFGTLLALAGLIAFGPGTTAAADQVEQGHEIYTRYCAACHGLAADGNGPLAPIMRGPFRTPPANLRRLSERYGNPLPADRIASFIDGREEVKAHGPRDMPVWGKRFYLEKEGSEEDTSRRLAALVAYLQSIQGGPAAASR